MLVKSRQLQQLAPLSARVWQKLVVKEPASVRAGKNHAKKKRI